MPARESRTGYAVLGALTLEPMSGYRLRAVLEQSVGHFWRESYGQLYPTLRRLEADGLVATEGRGRARVHRLTEAGWDELRAWLARPVTGHEPTRDELLLKVFLGRHAGPGVTAAHVAARRRVLDDLLTSFERTEAEVAADPSPDAPYWRLTVRHGIAMTRALRDWCDEALPTLEQLEDR